MKNGSVLPTILVCAALVMSACAPTAPASTPAPVTLKVVVLPILEALPMYVAQQQGYFTKHGVNVELVVASSGPERDQIIASGQADGMVNEVLSTLFYNKNEVQAQIVRFSRTATKDSALFRIVAGKNSAISDVNGLKGVEIGSSDGTIIAYLVDRLLQLEGFKQEEIKTTTVPKIPDRLALLSSGSLKAAMLPDPTSFTAVNQGGTIVLDDTRHPEISYSVLTFRKASLDQKGQAVKNFLAAIEDATDKINADPAQFTQLLVDQKILPATLAGAFKVPTFAKKGVPSKEQYNDVLAWAKAKKLLDKDIPYESCVNGGFLP